MNQFPEPVAEERVPEEQPQEAAHPAPAAAPGRSFLRRRSTMIAAATAACLALGGASPDGNLLAE